MSKESHPGSVKSYVVGFLLSLIFTFSAYYIVVNKSFSAHGILQVILMFALLQMSVQIFFFLHLGRGPKPLYNVTFFVGTAGLIVVVVAGSIFIMNNLHYNMSPAAVTTKLSQDEGIAEVGNKKTGACQELKVKRQVIIKDGVVSPSQTDAALCDTLTIINEDSATRDIAFGPHNNHETYGGQDEFSVPKNYPKTITLNQAGTYRFHDHDDETVIGTFTVTP